MDAHVLDSLAHRVREFIELIVEASSPRKRKDAIPDDTARRPEEETQASNEACVCQQCLDILSRTHSAGAARYRHHEHDFIHHWLSEESDTDFLCSKSLDRSDLDRTAAKAELSEEKQFVEPILDSLSEAVLRQDADLRAVSVITYTSRDLTPAERQQLTLGRTLFITKTVGTQELAEVVLQLLQSTDTS